MVSFKRDISLKVTSGRVFARSKKNNTQKQRRMTFLCYLVDCLIYGRALERKNPISIAITIFVRADYERLLYGFIFELAKKKKKVKYSFAPLICWMPPSTSFDYDPLPVGGFYEANKAISNGKACAAKLLQWKLFFFCSTWKNKYIFMSFMVVPRKTWTWSSLLSSQPTTICEMRYWRRCSLSLSLCLCFYSIEKISSQSYLKFGMEQMHLSFASFGCGDVWVTIQPTNQCPIAI